MTMDTFLAVLDMEPVRGHGVLSFGTGEPTVHPQFLEMLQLAMADNRWFVRVVTNGKRKKLCLEVAALAAEGKIEGHLSLDEWHDPIPSEVVEAFKRDVSNPVDKRAYRICRPQDLKNVGRCDFGPDSRPTCRCPVPKVRPDGSVYWCGCENAVRLGDVRTWDRTMLCDKRKLGCDGFLLGANKGATKAFFGRLGRALMTGGDR
jgi:MoaA/NifB/PqqE/SkfB family radical SAM enzyme